MMVARVELEQLRGTLYWRRQERRRRESCGRFQQLENTLSEIKRTDAELSQMIGLLKRASEVGTDVPFDSMSFVFENRDSAELQFQNNALKLDAFVGLDGRVDANRSRRVGFYTAKEQWRRTHAIYSYAKRVCLRVVFMREQSRCASVQRQSAIDMLRKSVSMGKRKDKRITADGLLLTAEDARGKVQRYVEILESSSIFSKSSK